MKFKAGDKVQILSGPWSGCTGEVITTGSAVTLPYPYGVRFRDPKGQSRQQAFAESELEAQITSDNVNNPSHYTWLPGGLEVIDLTEHLMSNRGNVVKYVCRAGRKNPDAELEDLQKALWYLQREISRVEKTEAK
ncbi:DUF3310 domain-containing protein [Streptomyces griseofuscus]|uniref:DUF3310 domain-containing protein n=1 Tax=Streptomyces griseofuscus TaxID=146922 RepID=UPI00369EE583